MENSGRYGDYEIARSVDGAPLGLPRAADEIVFLAFDLRIKRLVELHILKSGKALAPDEKTSAMERLKRVAALGGGQFLNVLDWGEVGDAVFYSCALNDGEWLDDYIARRGTLPPATAFCLTASFLDELVKIEESPELLSGVSLDRLLLTLQEDTFLQLRVMDLGLAKNEPGCSMEETHRRLVYEACLVLFNMLTGKSFAGENCDRYPALTSLPAGLRTTLRSSLGSLENAPSSLGRLRDQVREALATQTRDLPGRNSRRHLVATDSMLPRSSLRQVLLHEVNLEKLLAGQLLQEGGEQARYPFVLLVSDARTTVPLTLHLLPPQRIVAREHYDAVPLQMWRCNADKHPNILRSFSVWESPDLTFHTEERGPGFPLSRLIAERVFLNPSEVLALLRQVKAGLDQAQECGIERMDIHPCNLMLRLVSTPPAREMERLLQKRLDAWPRFLVMLRPHMTMRGLYEPFLAPAVGNSEDADADARDFRNRSFVALAASLLCGGHPADPAAAFPDTVPDDLAAFMRRCLAKNRTPGGAPSPKEFLAEFERHAAISEAAGIALTPPRQRPRLVRISSEPMESAGSVSDFEEDHPHESAHSPAVMTGVRKTSVIGSIAEAQKGGEGKRMTALVAGVLAALLVAGGLIFRYKPTETAAPPVSQTGAPKQEHISTPQAQEEVRRALLLTPAEKDELLLKQRSGQRVASEFVATDDAPILGKP
jgi:hypothetical protein